MLPIPEDSALQLVLWEKMFDVRPSRGLMDRFDKSLSSKRFSLGKRGRFFPPLRRQM